LLKSACIFRVPEEGKVEVGAFVRIYIERVQRAAAESIVTKSVGGGGAYAPLVVTSLAKYENRMGMVHWRVTSYRGESNSIRSKDTLVLVQVSPRPRPLHFTVDVEECEIRGLRGEVADQAARSRRGQTWDHTKTENKTTAKKLIQTPQTLNPVQGGRRCEIRPVFSEVSETASNHKMHRFLPATGSCVASAYAPIW
jgi:hypothetical protein